MIHYQAKPVEAAPLSPMLILRYLSQMASAMYFVHTRDVVHRDLKLENILLSFEGLCGDIRICDLGLARFIVPLCGKSQPPDPNFLKSELHPHARTGTRWKRPEVQVNANSAGIGAADSEIYESTLTKGIGTLGFIPPEQMMGTKLVQQSAARHCAKAWDIYSFGVIINCLIEQRPNPFAGLDSASAFAAAQKGATPDWPLMEKKLGDDNLTFTHGDATRNALQEMRALAERCWLPSEQRPNFSEVYLAVKEILGSLDSAGVVISVGSLAEGARKSRSQESFEDPSQPYPKHNNINTSQTLERKFL